jgi:hypothetical protein
MTIDMETKSWLLVEMTAYRGMLLVRKTHPCTTATVSELVINGPILHLVFGF